LLCYSAALVAGMFHRFCLFSHLTWPFSAGYIPSYHYSYSRLSPTGHLDRVLAVIWFGIADDLTPIYPDLHRHLSIFLYVHEDKPTVIDVPVQAAKGLAAGVKSGGKLSLDKREAEGEGTTAPTYLRGWWWM